jgi:hypothetical protein
MGNYYSGTIQKGSTGEDVKRWQKYLNTQGHNLTVDGIFGDNTLNATTAYQTANGLSADGIVGEKTWGKAGFSNINTPVSAPTASPMPTAPTYDSTSWDDTQKGQDALKGYQDAQAAVDNYGPFQYSNMEQFNALMEQIMGREKFTYDFNGDALYQQYKDKYIKQGKMAMGDAIGQASAMTGGYGNSYAQSVGQQAYQAQLENLNDIIPELYQMALDKYNMEGQELLNQYGVLSDDYNRELGAYNTEYDRLMDILGIKRGDYYDGADMFYTEQGNKNTAAGNAFDDAMSIWQNETNQAWKEAEWAEGQRQYEIDQDWKEKEFNQAYGVKLQNGTLDPVPNKGKTTGGANYDNGGYGSDVVKKAQAFVGASADGQWGPNSAKAAKAKGYDSIADVVNAMGGDNPPKTDTPAVSEAIVKNVQNYGSRQGQADYLAGQVNAGKITEAQAMELLDQYGVVDLVDRSWEMVDDGGWNWFGIGIDANAKVRDQFGNTYTLSELRKELKKTMTNKQANEYIKNLEKRLGI